MGKLLMNEKLGYNVDITAGLWREVITECQERKLRNEEVDLVIGVDGKPIILPTNMYLRHGEWESNLRYVLRGIRRMMRLLEVGKLPLGVVGADILHGLQDGELEQIIAYLTVTDDGIVMRYRTEDRREAWDRIRRDYATDDVISCLREHPTENRYGYFYRKLMERHDYDIIHNTQYIIDNFGYPANRQEKK